MRNYTRNSSFHRDVNQKYAPDTDIFCSICGYGIYPDELVTWDGDGQICHADCIEQEEYNPDTGYVHYSEWW